MFWKQKCSTEYNVHVHVLNMALIMFKAIVSSFVNWNGFPSIFQKVQYFHSRHYKTTSHLLRISLNGILKLNEVWPLEGAMYISLWENSRGHPDNVEKVLCKIFYENWWFRTKRFTGLWELIQLLWTITIWEIFHFHHLPKLYFGFNTCNMPPILWTGLKSSYPRCSYYWPTWQFGGGPLSALSKEIVRLPLSPTHTLLPSRNKHFKTQFWPGIYCRTLTKGSNSWKLLFF